MKPNSKNYHHLAIPWIKIGGGKDRRNTLNISLQKVHRIETEFRVKLKFSWSSKQIVTVNSNFNRINPSVCNCIIPHKNGFVGPRERIPIKSASLTSEKQTRPSVIAVAAISVHSND